MTVTCTAMGVVTEEGIEIDGKLYSIGDAFNARFGSTGIRVMVSSIG